ncbi:MAG: hypothetical protein MI740_10355 [Halanaerobiales bacterium]|nr:hypothetical protein [Halanaerobiales bacterium]
MMLVIQKKDFDNWLDIDECENVIQAKKYIKNIVETEGEKAENYRVIMPILRCVTTIEFISDMPKEEKEAEETEKKESKPEKTDESPKPRKPGFTQVYTDEQLKLLYFERSCQLNRWARTRDFSASAGDKFPTWATFRSRLGSISNVKDMVAHELRKDPISLKYREIIDQYYTNGKERHTGVYVIKRLNEI